MLSTSGSIAPGTSDKRSLRGVIRFSVTIGRSARVHAALRKFNFALQNLRKTASKLAALGGEHVLVQATGVVDGVQCRGGHGEWNHSAQSVAVEALRLHIRPPDATAPGEQRSEQEERGHGTWNQKESSLGLALDAVMGGAHRLPQSSDRRSIECTRSP